MYSDKVEMSLVVKDVFVQLADSIDGTDCLFGMINLAKNEIKELEDAETPSMVVLKGYADLNAVNYEGPWVLEKMRAFVIDRM